MIEVTSPNAAALIAKLQNAPRRVREEVRQTLRIEAEAVATEAKLRCPVDTGALRQSIHADAPTDGPDGPEIRIVAGEGLGYARRQHEDESLRHTVGEAKFLKRAVDQERPRIAAQVREAVLRGLQE